MDPRIPVPGNGTESYNCDEDAVYAHSDSSQTAEDAVSSFTESVLKTRMKRGGRNWAPREKTT